jgi:hypothetical protein
MMPELADATAMDKGNVGMLFLQNVGNDAREHPLTYVTRVGGGIALVAFPPATIAAAATAAGLAWTDAGASIFGK